MFSKVKEIAQAWIVAARPNSKQKELAQKRYSICLDCEHFRKSRPITHDEYCNECLCPLDKKIFTQTNNACPLDKWKDIDETYSEF